MIPARAYWAAANALPVVPLSTIVPGRALVLAPHPDDESLGCGGLIAEACAQGTPPLVVVLTDGAGSHPRSRSHPPQRLRAVREAETVRAADCLGLTADRVVFLRYADTAAPTHGAALTAAAARIANLLRQHACDTILAPSRHDPHCDHEAAHCIAALAARDAAVRHRCYPVWALTLPPDHAFDAPPTGLRLDISPHRTAKQRAILSHASQYAGLISDDPSGFQMEPGFIARFDTAHELYLDPA